MTDAIRKSVLVGVLVGGCWITAGGTAGKGAPPEQSYGTAGAGSSTAEAKPSAASEPFLERFSLVKAAEYLDAAAHAREKDCFACHATFAYLAARPAISVPAAVHRETRQALEQAAARLADAKPGPEEKSKYITDAVMTAAVLAQHDAATGGRLNAVTRTALDRIWDMQRADGSWNWVKNNEPPSEVDDHFGVTTAAIGVGMAPDGYAATPQAQAGLERIRGYLRAHQPATMHQRAMLLLAAAHVEGLLTGEEKRQTDSDLFALQRPDGGWSMAGLADWKRVDGAALDPSASDGYGTGLAVYALRRGGITAEDVRLQRAVVWMKTHQRVSGCWFTRSPYKNDDLSTYAGTAYVILALDACGEIPRGESPR